MAGKTMLCAFMDRECSENCEAHMGVNFRLEGRDHYCERVVNSQQLHMSISEVSEQLKCIDITLDRIADIMT